MAIEVYELSVNAIYLASPLTNVFHFEVNGAGTPDEVSDALMSALDTPTNGWLELWCKILNTDYQVMALKARCVSVPGRTRFLFSSGIDNSAGTRTQEAPFQNQNWNAGLKWLCDEPKHDGRSFITGLYVDDFVNGVIQTAAETPMLNFAAYHTTPFVVSGRTIVGCLWGHSVTDPGPPVVFGPYSKRSITDYAVSPFGWQQGGRRYPVW